MTKIKNRSLGHMRCMMTSQLVACVAVLVWDSQSSATTVPQLTDWNICFYSAFAYGVNCFATWSAVFAVCLWAQAGPQGWSQGRTSGWLHVLGWGSPAVITILSVVSEKMTKLNDDKLNDDKLNYDNQNYDKLNYDTHKDDAQITATALMLIVVTYGLLCFISTLVFLTMTICRTPHAGVYGSRQETTDPMIAVETKKTKSCRNADCVCVDDDSATDLAACSNKEHCGVPVMASTAILIGIYLFLRRPDPEYVHELQLSLKSFYVLNLSQSVILFMFYLRDTIRGVLTSIRMFLY